MSKKFKRVTAYYPVEDIVQVELLLEVDDTITDHWQERIAVYLNEDISKEEWEENYEGDDND